jgi:hypothetical protein
MHIKTKLHRLSIYWKEVGVLEKETSKRDK